MIGLEKILEVFNLNSNQIAKELGVSRQTVYDWLKEKRKIPEQRLDQMAGMPRFKFINKELFQKRIDEMDLHDIEIAYINYLSDKDRVIIQDDGFYIEHDPYSHERDFLLKLKARTLELHKAEKLIHEQEFLEEFYSELGEFYSNVLGRLNNLFQQRQMRQIEALDIILTLFNTWGTQRKLKSELAIDLKKVLDKHGLTIDWEKREGTE